MRTLMTAAWLGLALTGPLAAAPAEPPATPPPAGTAQPEPKGDPVMERQRNTAAKLAGMVRFVDGACPDAKPDYDRFRKVISGMGVDIKDLEQGELMIRSLNYTEAYRKETADSCKKAVEQFGENGKTLPGLIVRKAP